jgi:hypothetical protein
MRAWYGLEVVTVKEIVGAWQLERYDARAADGAPAYPLGLDANGYLVYTADIARAPASGLARRLLVATGQLLFHGLVLTGRGLAITGRVTAGLFAWSFDAAVSTAAAKDADGRPLGIWPPRQF